MVKQICLSFVKDITQLTTKTWENCKFQQKRGKK